LVTAEQAQNTGTWDLERLNKHTPGNRKRPRKGQYDNHNDHA
jgi:hypothetical protein